jgi:hypothetical protein
MPWARHYRPGNRIMNTAVHLFSQAKDRGGLLVLLLSCRYTGSDPAAPFVDFL